jgi:tRNA (guanine37-N1)-methyltransferase
VLKPEPLFEAVESLLGNGVRSEVDSRIEVGARHAVPLQNENAPSGSQVADAHGTAIVLLSASGKLFRQDTTRRFAQLDRIILLCGRYEGVDERVVEHLATDELSIGDFVLSGGELAAALVMDAVTRLIPGALGNEDSSVNESFSAMEGLVVPAAQVTNHESRLTNHGILDYPHYTRPAEFRGWPVPEILIGGNHEQIRRWRQEKALEKTRRNRPDLLAGAILNRGQ